MKSQARALFIFSFVSFLLVFLFGMVLSPLKKNFTDPEVLRNLNLFHNHFDQLTWLGAAAVGSIFHYFGDAYRGSSTVLRLFTIAYITGPPLFSIAFLVRAIGLMADSSILHKAAFTAMLALGGLLNVILVMCGVYIAARLMTIARTSTSA